MLQGTVYSSMGKQYWVKTEHGLYKCVLRGRIRLDDHGSTNPISVGDSVSISTIEDDKVLSGIIQEIHPRNNYLHRKSTQHSNKRQILASNIDQALLVVTLEYPRTHIQFIDRFLVTLEFQNILGCLVFNKMDLYNSEQLKTIERLKTVYRNIGYPVFNISTISYRNIDKLKHSMNNKLNLFVGNSGVGKTSIINCLDKTLDLKTSNLTARTSVGRHTTRRAQIIDINQKIRIIDTPGIKGLGLIDIPTEKIKHLFPEFIKVSHLCTYSDCNHIDEPNCGVLDYIEMGKIAQSRYDRYLSMLQPDSRYR